MTLTRTHSNLKASKRKPTKIQTSLEKTVIWDQSLKDIYLLSFHLGKKRKINCQYLESGCKINGSQLFSMLTHKEKTFPFEKRLNSDSKKYFCDMRHI